MGRDREPWERNTLTDADPEVIRADEIWRNRRTADMEPPASIGAVLADSDRRIGRDSPAKRVETTVLRDNALHEHQTVILRATRLGLRAHVVVVDGTPMVLVSIEHRSPERHASVEQEQAVLCNNLGDLFRALGYPT